MSLDARVCPQCGKRMSINGAKYAKKLEHYQRNRVCDYCAYAVYTLEIDRDEYEKLKRYEKIIEKFSEVVRKEGIK